MNKREIDAFLQGVHLARVATVRPDGRPHVAPVWYLWQEGTLYFETARDSVKARNLMVNPAIAVTIDVTAGGLRLLYVILEGDAAFVEEPHRARALAERIYVRYVGDEGLQTPSVKSMLAGDFVIVSLKPSRVIALDQMGPSHLAPV